MNKKRTEILAKIKAARPEFTDEQCKEYLETLEVFCELVVKYTLSEETKSNHDKSE